MNLFRTVDADIEKKKSVPPVDPSTQPLMDAFQSEYIGAAHKELSTYVDSCWAKFKEAPTLYKYPYCAIVQSSGFGKTRLLRELAVLFEDRNRHVMKEENKGDELHRLVYVNVRDVAGSTIYPPTTTELKSHFFPHKVPSGYIAQVPLADKLVHLFLFVMQPDAPRASSDDKTIKTLSDEPSTMHQLLMNLFLGNDTPLTEALKATDTSTLKAVHASHSSPTQRRRLMVFAVDEARALLPKSEADGIGWFQILRRALALANATLRVLLSQEVLDAGHVDVVVARIVLLLAMDACARLEGDSKATHWSGAGEFFSVWTLLTALQGSSVTLRVVDPSEEPSSRVREADTTETQEALKAVESQWKDWFVSFAHFVQMAEAPSEACLWAMLGRRAAGVMPRGQKAVDLVIPICTGGTKGGKGEVIRTP